jgi:hypothetical protein
MGRRLGVIVIVALVAACGTLTGTEDGNAVDADGGSPDGSTDARSSEAGDDATISEPPAFLPSHVTPGSIPPLGPALSGVSTIDTSDLSISIAATKTSPPWLVAASPSVAILAVSSWKIDKNVSIRGTRALVVVVAHDVTIDGNVDAAAELDKPGPGGALPASGPGTGGVPTSTSAEKGGGGGAGYATAGAKGEAGGAQAGGQPGPVYGIRPGDFLGGSGGADGAGTCPNGDGHGGAGGGALQISAGGIIAVRGPASVNAGGGGGRGGCIGTSGGGGGSGGMIFFEALGGISVVGTLAANGGGGGGGGGDMAAPSSGPGTAGQNGTKASSPATGGAPGTGCLACGGGNGGFAINPPTTVVGPGSPNGGGGGGAVGVIWLRSTAKAKITRGGTESPPATPDDTLR